MKGRELRWKMRKGHGLRSTKHFVGTVRCREIGPSVHMTTYSWRSYSCYWPFVRVFRWSGDSPHNGPLMRGFDTFLTAWTTLEKQFSLLMFWNALQLVWLSLMTEGNEEMFFYSYISHSNIVLNNAITTNWRAADFYGPGWECWLLEFIEHCEFPKWASWYSISFSRAYIFSDSLLLVPEITWTRNT